MCACCLLLTPRLYTSACWGIALPPAQVMLAGTQPPPSSTSRSCVYVVKRSDGMFYCGQSDNLTSTPLPALLYSLLSFLPVYLRAPVVLSATHDSLR